MKTFAMLVLLFTTALACSQASAPPSTTKGTGADLAQKCSDAQTIQRVEDGVAAGYAQGYCFGVITTAAELLDAEGAIHFPDGASFGQIQKIVTNYLSAHPEEWQKPASLLVRKALKQAWGA